MGLQAGRLNRRITLLRHGLSYDSHNQPVDAWANIAEVSASWRRATARERLATGQVGSQATDLFEIRWTPVVANLNPKDRLEYKGRTYDIVDVAEIDVRGGLRITAAARTD